MKKKDVGATSATAESAKTKDRITLEVKRPRGRPLGQSDILTLDEMKTMLRLPDRRAKVGLRDYVVMLTLTNTPMRKGELIRLTVGSLIDEGTKKFISYKSLKKRKQRDKVTGEIKIKQRPYWLKIPIATDVFEGILRYVQSEHKGKVSHDTPLFMTTGIRGPYAKRALTPVAVDGIVTRYARLAGIKKRITPHSFRATYLTLRSQGHSPQDLLGLSGHKDISGIMPYLRGSEEKRRAAALSFTVT